MKIPDENKTDSYIVCDIETTGLFSWFGDRITCICAKDSDDNEFSLVHQDEQKIIKGFFAWLQDRCPADFNLLTYNGKGFVTPFILSRLAQRDRIYKANDPLKLAMIFFPQKTAKIKRAAFLAIYFELRNAKDKKLETLNFIPLKYKISHSVFVKARSKMKRIGLINRYSGMWTFSEAFENSMARLCENLRILQTASKDRHDETLENIYIETAKSLETTRQYRLKKGRKKEADSELYIPPDFPLDSPGE